MIAFVDGTHRSLVASPLSRQPGTLDPFYTGEKIILDVVPLREVESASSPAWELDPSYAADFTGYGGKGTEDLFIIWRRWFPRGLRLCAIPHCPCDHVIRDAKAGVIHVMARHETNSDTEGHLRKSFLPFQQHTAGESAAPDLKTFAK